ncbi:MAG: hypothetical protein E7399_06535 [Ruminococcaceae bacterium]|nr:hypothetical protein [Oscillospiraceae bacterium]
MSTLEKPRKHGFRFLFFELRNRLGDCPWRGWMPDRERLMPRATKLKLLCCQFMQTSFAIHFLKVLAISCILCYNEIAKSVE